MRIAPQAVTLVLAVAASTTPTTEAFVSSSSSFRSSSRNTLTLTTAAAKSTLLYRSSRSSLLMNNIPFSDSGTTIHPRIGDFVGYYGSSSGSDILRVGKITFVSFDSNKEDWMVDVLEFKPLRASGLYSEALGRQVTLALEQLKPLQTGSFDMLEQAYRLPLDPKTAQPKQRASCYTVETYAGPLYSQQAQNEDTTVSTRSIPANPVNTESSDSFPVPNGLGTVQVVQPTQSIQQAMQAMNAKVLQQQEQQEEDTPKVDEVEIGGVKLPNLRRPKPKPKPFPENAEAIVVGDTKLPNLRPVPKITKEPQSQSPSPPPQQPISAHQTSQFFSSSSSQPSKINEQAMSPDRRRNKPQRMQVYDVSATSSSTSKTNNRSRPNTYDTGKPLQTATSSILVDTTSQQPRSVQRKQFEVYDVSQSQPPGEVPNLGIQDIVKQQQGYAREAVQQSSSSAPETTRRSSTLEADEYRELMTRRRAQSQAQPEKDAPSPRRRPSTVLQDSNEQDNFENLQQSFQNQVQQRQQGWGTDFGEDTSTFSSKPRRRTVPTDKELFPDNSIRGGNDVRPTVPLPKDVDPYQYNGEENDDTFDFDTVQSSREDYGRRRRATRPSNTIDPDFADWKPPAGATSDFEGYNPKSRSRNRNNSGKRTRPSNTLDAEFADWKPSVGATSDLYGYSSSRSRRRARPSNTIDAEFSNYRPNGQRQQPSERRSSRSNSFASFVSNLLPKGKVKDPFPRRADTRGAQVYDPRRSSSGSSFASSNRQNSIDMEDNSITTVLVWALCGTAMISYLGGGGGDSVDHLAKQYLIGAAVSFPFVVTLGLSSSNNNQDRDTTLPILLPIGLFSILCLPQLLGGRPIPDTSFVLPTLDVSQLVCFLVGLATYQMPLQLQNVVNNLQDWAEDLDYNFLQGHNLFLWALVTSCGEIGLAYYLAHDLPLAKILGATSIISNGLLLGARSFNNIGASVVFSNVLLFFLPLIVSVSALLYSSLSASMAHDYGVLALTCIASMVVGTIGVESIEDQDVQQQSLQALLSLGMAGLVMASVSFVQQYELLPHLKF